ncbi:MAG: hypothetical protein ACSLFL_16585 [Alphaproteobacteria bacterium]
MTKDCCDFSKGVCSKFYLPNAVLRLPVYPDEKVEKYLAAKADAKGVELQRALRDH